MSDWNVRRFILFSLTCLGTVLSQSIVFRDPVIVEDSSVDNSVAKEVVNRFPASTKEDPSPRVVPPKKSSFETPYEESRETSDTPDAPFQLQRADRFSMTGPGEAVFSSGAKTDSNQKLPKTADSFGREESQSTKTFSNVPFPRSTSLTAGAPAGFRDPNNVKDSGKRARFSVKKISLVNGNLVIEGSNLTTVNSIRLRGHSISDSLSKVSASASRYVAQGVSGLQLVAGKVYDLIIADAYGQTTFPIDITLQDGSVGLRKLEPLSAAEDGYVLKWDDAAQSWVASPELGGGGGGGSVISVTRGAGILNSGTAITSTGTISVDTGSGANQVLAWDAGKKLKLDSSNLIEVSPASAVAFKDSAEEYRLQVASNIFQIWSVTDNAAVFELNGNALSVNGKGVCLSDGTNCAAAAGVQSITAGSGLLGGTITTTGTLSVDTDNSTIEVSANKLRLKDGGVTAIKLNQMGASVGNVLKWTMGGWAPAADSGLTVESDPNVKAFAKTVLPLCDPDETLATVAPLLDSLTCVPIVLGSDAITEGATNKYFSDARARAATVADAIVNETTDVAPSQNAVFDALALKQNTLDSTSDVSVRSLTATRTLSGNTGVEYVSRVLPTITQSGTAGYTGLLVNVSETSTGSGAKKLLDLQVGGVSMFSVDSTGAVTRPHRPQEQPQTSPAPQETS